MNNTVNQPIKNLNEFFDTLVFNMGVAPLSSVPFHSDTDCIERYFSSTFPLHFAVHEVSETEFPPEEYTQVHIHENHHEMNAIISSNELEYRITLGEKDYLVKNNASIWIPAGVPHSANVIKGTGFFFAIRIEKSTPIPSKYLLNQVIKDN